MSIVFDFEDINRRMNRKPEPVKLEWEGPAQSTLSTVSVSELNDLARSHMGEAIRNLIAKAHWLSD